MKKEHGKDYCLTELIEPTDEQLVGIMKEVAQEAKEKSKIATSIFFQKLYEHLEEKKKEWSKKYPIIIDHA